MHDKKNKYLCFVRANDIRHEYDTEKVVVSKNRNCPKYVPYKIGYSPKEVAEFVYSEKMLIKAQERIDADKIAAEARLKEDRAERKDQRDKDIAREQEQRDKDIAREQEQRDKDFWHKLIIPIVAAACGAALTAAFRG